MSICNWWDLQTLGSQPLIKLSCPKVSPITDLDAWPRVNFQCRQNIIYGDVFHAGYPRNTFPLHF